MSQFKVTQTNLLEQVNVFEDGCFLEKIRGLVDGEFQYFGYVFALKPVLKDIGLVALAFAHVTSQTVLTASKKCNS